MRHVLLALAIILTVIGTAGGAAMLVHGRLTAEHVFDKARALAEQRWHHDNAMEAARASVSALEIPEGLHDDARDHRHAKKHPGPGQDQKRPKQKLAHQLLPAPPHGRRQPGDDSANALNRDFLAGR